MALHVMFEGS
jgi:hypothetical protein